MRDGEGYGELYPRRRVPEVLRESRGQGSSDDSGGGIVVEGVCLFEGLRLEPISATSRQSVLEGG